LLPSDGHCRALEDSTIRCKACDIVLNKFESTRKYKDSGEFIDLCNGCYTAVKEDVQAIERYDLMEFQDELDNEE
jgi:hypothetical protein